MARVADHELKREEVAEAVQRVIARHGIDAATIREIAREAGCSAGALAHYFRSKDDLLLYAFRLTSERAMARAGRWVGRGPGLATLRAAVLETLPLDDDRRVEVQTWCSFLGKAISRPAMAAVQREQEAAWRALLCAIIEAGQRDGTIRRDLEASEEAEALSAVIDGLTIQAIVEPDRLPPERQCAYIDRYLAGLTQASTLLPSEGVGAARMPAPFPARSRRRGG